MESEGLPGSEEISRVNLAQSDRRFHDHLKDYQPPRYTIDLSLPPAERYKHVAQDFKSEIASLPILFDDVVQSLSPKISVKFVQRLARIFLRRLYDDEETEELRGIQQVTGIEMFFLVAFNVLLDLLMGCTSGGVRVSADSCTTKMLHFRTMDWGMDPLRKIVVLLEFIEGAGGDVIASSITYVGFVGVLTGIKNPSSSQGAKSNSGRAKKQQPLSMSLNFRPNHDASTWILNLRFYLHHLCVLFGFRPSISSLLRQCLLPSLYSSPITGSSPTLKSVENDLAKTKSTAAYLIFSDGDRTITLEKDYGTAVIKSSGDFIVTCNHDVLHEDFDDSSHDSLSIPSNSLKATGIEALVVESVSRKGKLVELWEKFQAQQKRRSSRRSTKPGSPLTMKNIFRWIDTYPITNEETHFAVVMDPKAGRFVWIKRYLDPAYVLGA